MLLQSDKIESGFSSIILGIILVAGVFAYIGTGQGFSLVFCVGAMLLVAGFFVWIIKIKWTAGSSNKKINIPFSIVGLFTFQILGIVMLVPFFLQLINPKWVSIFIKYFYLPPVYLSVSFISCLIVSFVYLRRIVVKVSGTAKPIFTRRVWIWTILWTLAKNSPTHISARKFRFAGNYIFY